MPSVVCKAITSGLKRLWTSDLYLPQSWTFAFGGYGLATVRPTLSFELVYNPRVALTVRPDVRATLGAGLWRLIVTYC